MAAETIADKSPQAQITLISDEDHPYYYRFMLGEYLCGQISRERLDYKPVEYYESKNIKLRLSQRALEIDAPNKEVLLYHKERVPYDKLLLATGASTKIPPYYQRFAAHLLPFSSIQDAEEIMPRAKEAQNALVIGGGLTGVTLALALRRCGLALFCILLKRSFYPLLWSDADFANIVSLLKDEGIELFIDKDIENIGVENGGGLNVSLLDGTQLKCDFIGASFGIEPNIDLAKSANISAERGILTDEYLQTNVPDIFAAGDVAQIYHSALRNYWVNLGQPNAIRQGKIAGLNMCGLEAKYEMHLVNIKELSGKTIRFRQWE